MPIIKILTILLNLPLLRVLSASEQSNHDRLGSLNDHKAVFDQPLTQGSYNFDSDGFIPLEPLTRIRKIHKEMMYTIQSVNDHKKQVSYLLTLCNTANDDIIKLRQKIESSVGNYSDLNKEFLKADAFILLTSHLSLIANLVLYFPGPVHAILKKNQEFDLNVKWVIEFVTTVNIISDKHLLKLMHLMKQELGLVVKDDDYQNPYKRQKIVIEPSTTTKKPRRKLERGPRLSNFEL